MSPIKKLLNFFSSSTTDSASSYNNSTETDEDLGAIESDIPTVVITEEKYPVRLMFGIGCMMGQGFSIVCEKEDSSAHADYIWFTDDEFKLVKFVDTESIATYTVSKSTLDDREETWYDLKALEINRDCMQTTTLGVVSSIGEISYETTKEL